MAHLSLRAKSLAAMALACLLVLVPALLLGIHLSERVRTHFGQAYAENLTLLNRQKILAPIAIDLALSRRLASSEVTRQWLNDESHTHHRELFFREAEGYRQDLRDQSYFIASAQSGNYYFNEGEAPVSSAPRYSLSPQDPADAWFYATLKSPAPYNVNVNPDPKLGVTRVWINARVTEGDRTLGLTGSSIDLTEFLQSLAGTGQSGVNPMVTDRAGAIQAHADRNRIAFNSGAARQAGSATVFNGLSAVDAAALHSAMRLAREQAGLAQSLSLAIEGSRYLMSIAHIPELDWYVMTEVNPAAAQVMDTRWMWAGAVGIVAIVAALLAVCGYGIERMVLRPVRQLQQSARAIANGQYDVTLPRKGSDEIGDLSSAFGEMAAKVSAHTTDLEERVRERTSELQAANLAMKVAQKKISDSIDYASLIQRSILPDRQMTQSLGDQQFVLWRPRDIVGGDFYVFRADGDNCLLGLMDCAGHGVPGALMTMLARAAIDLAIQDVGTNDPAAILIRCDSAMRAMLAESHLPRALATNADAGFIYIDKSAGRLLFAGARLSLYASDGTRVHEYPGARRALVDKRPGMYSNIELPLSPGWTFYLVTDGFLDQAGGDHGFGFGDQRFRTMLAEHAALPLADQPTVFSQALARYQGDHPQRDDITMLSFRFEKSS